MLRLHKRYYWRFVHGILGSHHPLRHQYGKIVEIHRAVAVDIAGKNHITRRTAEVTACFDLPEGKSTPDI